MFHSWNAINALTETSTIPQNSDKSVEYSARRSVWGIKPELIGWSTGQHWLLLCVVAVRLAMWLCVWRGPGLWQHLASSEAARPSGFMSCQSPESFIVLASPNSGRNWIYRKSISLQRYQESSFANLPSSLISFERSSSAQNHLVNAPT